MTVLKWLCKVFLAGLILPFVAWAQWQPPATKVALSFKLKDGQSEEPVVGAVVQVTSPADSSLAITGFSDEHGAVETMVPAYIPLTVRISHAFYRDTVIHIGILKENTFWGTVLLTPATQKLPEVTIKAKGVETEFERKEYVVTERMRKQAVTTTDLLKQLPEIQYDPFRDQILVQGKMKVLYLVNGIEKPAEYVKSISPKRILKIEIYRNPIGRYALEGYDAVINIILRDDYVGVETTVSGFGSLSTTRRYVPGNVPFVFSAARLSLVRYKTTFRLSFYNWRYHSFARSVDSFLKNDFPVWVQGTSPDDWNAESKGWGYSVYGGLDWKPSVNHMLVLDFNGGGILTPYYSHSERQATWQGGTLTARNTSESKPTNASLMLTHRWQFGRDAHLQTALSGGTQNTTSVSEYGEQTIGNDWNIRQVQKNEGIHWKAYSEWEGPLWGERLNLLAGALYEQNLQYSRLKVNVNDGGFSATLPEVKSRTHSLKPYAYLTWRVIKNVKFRLGTGVNYLQFVVNDTVNDAFFYWEPRIDLNWSAGKMANVSLSFDMDVKTPTAAQLLTAGIVKNRLVVNMGNENLRPYPTYRLRLTVDAFGGYFSLTPYYHWANNEIQRVWLPLTDSLLAVKPVQGVKRRQWGIRFSLPVPLYKRYVVAMVFGDYSVVSLQWQDVANRGSTFTTWAMVMYNNPEKGVMAGAGLANRIVPRPTLQGTEMTMDEGGGDFAGIFVQKMLWKRRLSVMLFYTLPMVFKPIDETFVTTVETADWHIVQKSHSPFMQGLVGLNVSVNFSKGKIVKGKQAPAQQKGFLFGM